MGRRRGVSRAVRFLAAATASLAIGLSVHGTARALTLLAVADAYSVGHDRVLTVAAPGVLGNDVGLLGNPSAVYDSGPSHGFLVLRSDGGLTYTPVAGYVGQDTFRYHVHDGLLNSLPATVTITVTNAKPVAQNDWYTATTGVEKTVPAPGVLGNDSDADGDALTAQLVDGGGNGSLDFNANGSFTFRSGGSFTGNRTFTYRVTDGFDWSTTATVTIAVSPAPTPTPTPTPAPTPTPTPTPTPGPTPTPAPPKPTLPVPLPSLPLPTLTIPLPTPASTLAIPVPSLPVAEPTAGAEPTSSTATSPAPASPDASPAPTSNANAGGPGVGGTSGAGGAGAAGASDVQGGFVIPDAGFGTFDGIDAVEIGGFDWAVPTLLLSVPGLLLILAVLAQGSAGLLSLPVVRRSLGSFGLGRRREESREH